MTQAPDSNSVDRRPLLLQAQDMSERLIIDGHVDADNDRFDGVRALFQLLHGLPVTGFTCNTIRKVESEAKRIFP